MTGNGKGKLSKPFASTEYSEHYAIRPARYGESGWPFAIGHHPLKVVEPQAKFAMDCIERWAMVAGEIDGEDTAGRTRLRRMTADEIVKHACACAEKAFSEFEDRGWLVKVPSAVDLMDLIKDQENGND